MLHMLLQYGCQERVFTLQISFCNTLIRQHSAANHIVDMDRHSAMGFRSHLIFSDSLFLG